MKFYNVDDLHLEFSDLHLPGDKDGILLLAGDIMTPTVFREGRTDAIALKRVPQFKRFLHEECSKYKKAYWIAGNHEFYHGAWEDTRDLMRKAAEGTNITVLEKEWVDLGEDVHLYAATFWTDFKNGDPNVMVLATSYMNDYRVISCNYHYVSGMYANGRVGTLRPSTVLEDHHIAKQALIDGLDQRRGKKIVVMTHHAPSLLSSHPRHGKTDNPINWAYSSELDQFILDNPSIRYWVHGHTHDQHQYQIGSTTVLCNPRGYDGKVDGHEENQRFNDQLSFEV
jgi:hypothetical protein